MQNITSYIRQEGKDVYLGFRAGEKAATSFFKRVPMDYRATYKEWLYTMGDCFLLLEKFSTCSSLKDRISWQMPTAFLVAVAICNFQTVRYKHVQLNINSSTFAHFSVAVWHYTPKFFTIATIVFTILDLPKHPVKGITNITVTVISLVYKYNTQE